LKEEIDNRSALADSAVYSSFALFVSGLLWLVYAILSSSSSKHLNYLPHPAIASSLFLFLLLAGYVTYRTSVFIHHQFGEVFKSLYDLHLKDVDVEQVVEEVSRIIDDPSLIIASRKEKLTAAWRFLQNYRVKCPDPSCAKVLTPREFELHKASSHKSGKAAESKRSGPGISDTKR
jgi:hypothetical protein